MEKTARKIYNTAGDWMGIETVEFISTEEAAIRYPETFAKMKKDSDKWVKKD